MNIAFAQLRLPSAAFATNAARLLAAARQAGELGAALCLAPSHALSGWPVWLSVAGGAARHDALQRLAGELDVLSAPLLLGETEANGEPVAWFVRPGVVEVVPLHRGWGRVTISGRAFAVCVGSALHDSAVLPGRLDVAAVLHLDAEGYTPLRRGTLGERYAAVARQLGVMIFRAHGVGGSESWIWSGDSLAMGADGRLLAHLSPWKEGLAVVNTAAPSTAPLELTVDPALDTCEALITGLRDFVGDTGAQKVVLGLSGGMDSALVAALATAALGADKVLGVLMSSPWTSEASERDALELAERLGMETLALPISTLMQGVDSALEARFADKPRDVTEENVQSRIRGVLLMALANKEGRLLLATGNKSELGVGYCTLYGDTAGALAPLADVYKTTVYELASALNRRAGCALIPESVFTKAPTAELRPDQTDQDSLPPYAVLDAILYELVEQGRAPESVILPGVTSCDVHRVACLLQNSEFKRRQTPPALYVSERPFGVTRFPLLTKNYWQ